MIFAFAILLAAVFVLGFAICNWRWSSQLQSLKTDLKETEKRIMSALTDTLNQIKADIQEGTAELTAKIAALEASLTPDTLSPESQAALDDLKAAAKTLADIIPNA